MSRMKMKKLYVMYKEDVAVGVEKAIEGMESSFASQLAQIKVDFDGMSDEKNKIIDELTAEVDEYQTALVDAGIYHLDDDGVFVRVLPLEVVEFLSEVDVENALDVLEDDELDA